MTRLQPSEVTFKIAEAATKTKDIWVTSGTGEPECVCVFEDFSMNFTHDL